MKRVLRFFLTFFIYLFFLPILVGIKADDLSSIMSQGSIRTCLNRVSGGNQAHPRTGKMIMYATLNLAGDCQSQNGCEIWRYNGENDDIGVTDKELKDCKSGKKTRNCDADHIKHLEDELKSQVNVKPGWTQITDFTLLSSKPGQTDIALNNNDKTVLGATSSTVPQGKVSISVSDKFAGHVAYSYYAIGDATPVNKEVGQGGEPIQGKDPTQQLGTVVFDFSGQQTTIKGSKDDCITLYWDPFGRVFDSVSLEPMAGIDVTLLDNIGKPAVIDGPFNNWDTTKIDNGVYNILVSKEGDYQLKVTVPDSHLFTKEVSLNSNYSLIYSDIYLPGNIFHEAPMPEIIPENFDYSKYHHDIPIVPKSKPYYVDPVDVFVIKSSLHQVDMNDFINYSGKATFPKAKICLIGEKSQKIIENCVNAEKYGNFRINIDKNKVPQERLLLIAEKIDLTKPIIKSNTVDLTKIDFKDQNNLGFEPILNHIEGYAYDEKGQRIPKAKIIVKLKDGDLPFYTTYTDDSGFFTIYKKNLPFPEYYLEIIDPSGKVYQKTTSAFINDNSSYIESESLDLINSTKNDQPIEYKASDNQNQIKEKAEKSTEKTNKINPNLNFILTGIILVVLLTILAGVLIYIHQKKIQKKTL